MYGNFKEHVLNTTLFAKNISDTGYFCIDAVENLYVYFMYKFKQVNYDWINLILGMLQNFFQQSVYILAIYTKIDGYVQTQDWPNFYFALGKIT